MPSSAQVARTPSTSGSRLHSEYSVCTALTGCTACARRIVPGAASEMPAARALPAPTRPRHRPTRPPPRPPRAPPAARPRGGLGDARGADLARLDQLPDRSPRLLHRHRGVDPVLVVEVDDVDAEPLQRGVARAAHVVGPAVDAAEGAVLAALVAELGGQHHLVAPAGDRLADEALVGEGPVHVGGVEVRDAEVEGARDGAVGPRRGGGAAGPA